MLFFCLLLMHSKGAKIGSTQQDKITDGTNV